MSVKRILVLGGGFARLWSAVGAARKLDELGCGPEAVQVTLVNRAGFHNIRVRNYEALTATFRSCYAHSQKRTCKVAAILPLLFCLLFVSPTHAFEEPDNFRGIKWEHHQPKPDR